MGFTGYAKPDPEIGFVFFELIVLERNERLMLDVGVVIDDLFDIGTTASSPITPTRVVGTPGTDVVKTRTLPVTLELGSEPVDEGIVLSTGVISTPSWLADVDVAAAAAAVAVVVGVHAVLAGSFRRSISGTMDVRVRTARTNRFVKIKESADNGKTYKYGANAVRLSILKYWGLDEGV